MAQPSPIVPPATASATAPAVVSVTSLPDPSRFEWVRMVDGLRRPLDLKHTGDERLLVVEQAGLIRVVAEGKLQPRPFLDIRDRVNDGANEQGLLGLAFHPDYENNGLLFVNYTGDRGQTVIARFQVSSDPQVADPASELVLLQIEQPFANHNGGAMAFGPDGYLYVATGDGGSAGDPQGNGQRLDTLLGKLLRLDVDGGDPYTIPADNPFINGSGLPEIWNLGLRNPWRFAFDRLTGDLYLGDVGQTRWEEVDFQAFDSPGGINYGWNIREGGHPFASDTTSGLTDPVAEYDHDFGCSVTGGVVVRSPSLPDWQGVYLYGDYCLGFIWGLLRDPEGMWQSQVLFETNFRISSFGEDAAGEVYVIDQRGAVYRLEEGQ
ncbi:MAG: PQQ-dependent sugar dehydrogenase [Anaerolineales bacterium]